LPDACSIQHFGIINKDLARIQVRKYLIPIAKGLQVTCSQCQEEEKEYQNACSLDPPATTNIVTLTVNKASTSTIFVTSKSLTVYGEEVTFTATIGITPPGAGTPTGNVEFFDDGVSLGTAPLSSPTAYIHVGTLPIGSHQITAKYLGNANFNDSTSPPIIQVVLASTPVWAEGSKLWPGSPASSHPHGPAAGEIGSTDIVYGASYYHYLAKAAFVGMQRTQRQD
jgi:hypothetical protein